MSNQAVPPGLKDLTDRSHWTPTPAPSGMRFASAMTRDPETEEAGRALTDDIRCSFEGPCDLAILFFTPHHLEGILDVLDGVRARLGPRQLLGCSCEGVIGADQEVERQPGISLLVGTLPDVQVQPFQIDPGDWGPLTRDPEKLVVLARPRPDTRCWLTLADPSTTPVDEMLTVLERLTPGCPVIGGMASGGRPGQNILILNDRIYTAGMVGLTLSGSVRVDTVVSQGCRPIGRPLLVTAADENVIEQLGGRPALEVIQENLRRLPPEDQDQLEDNLCIGIVINEYQSEFGCGDFLVRNLIGANPETGDVAIGDRVQVGQTVQLHLRDAATADEELRLMMKRQGHGEAPAGGLIISCNGRGARMFSRPCHDVMAVLDAVPSTPVAGFFAQGELGPVGGRNYIHGHTASIALFRRPAGDTGENSPGDNIETAMDPAEGETATGPNPQE